mmetsp:Transcript_10177/g.34593  ORF Transcript_10177/g.34593 Transcript_10177/m.34593 type:complete len:271 (-) Transcript_10177:583-1395(-)
MLAIDPNARRARSPVPGPGSPIWAPLSLPLRLITSAAPLPHASGWGVPAQPRGRLRMRSRTVHTSHSCDRSGQRTSPPSARTVQVTDTLRSRRSWSTRATAMRPRMLSPASTRMASRRWSTVCFQWVGTSSMPVRSTVDVPPTPSRSKAVSKEHTNASRLPAASTRSRKSALKSRSSALTVMMSMEKKVAGWLSLASGGTTKTSAALARRRASPMGRMSNPYTSSQKAASLKEVAQICMEARLGSTRPPGLSHRSRAKSTEGSIASKRRK